MTRPGPPAGDAKLIYPAAPGARLTCGRHVYVLSSWRQDPWQDEMISLMRDEPRLVLGICLDSHVAATHDVARLAVDALMDAGHVAPSLAEDLWLILTELIANAHLHGNLRDGPPEEAAEDALQRGLALHVTRDENDLSLFVANPPPGATSACPVGPKHRPVVQGLSEGGLGMTIIQRLGGKITHTDDLSRWTVRLGS